MVYGLYCFFVYREKVGEEKGGERNLWEGCVNSNGVFHAFHRYSEGGKGEVTFSLSERSERSFAFPFPPLLFCEVILYDS